MAGDIVAAVGSGVEDLAKVYKKREMDAARDEVIYMVDVGLLFAEETSAEDIRNVACTDEDGTIIIGIDTTPKCIDIPSRHGTAERCAGWQELPEELKNKVHDFVLAALTDRSGAIDVRSALAWSATSRGIHREFTDILYSNIKLHFTVEDFDFAEVIHFLTNISAAACHSLLKNTNLHVTMKFSTDCLCDWMIRGTIEWLNTCKDVIKQLQRKSFNNIRIPWNYHAHGDDDIIHMEWEIEVSRWPKRFAEWDAELIVIKECFQQAPLLM